jgi:signal transduction histidine kinase
MNQRRQYRDVSATNIGKTSEEQGAYDMSEQRRPEPYVNRTVRLHHVIGRINAMMIRASSRTALFESISLVAGESGVFSAMSVSLHAHETEGASHGMCYCGKDTPGCFTTDFSCRLAETSQAGKHGRDAVVFNDLSSDSADHPWLQEVSAAGHGALASLPISTHERAIGRLVVLSREQNFFDHECLALLRQLAADIAFLVCRFDGAAAVSPDTNSTASAQHELRALLEHLQTAREDERRLISRELHDELGQTLSALKMDVLGIEHSLEPSDAKCAARLAHMKSLITDALAETHRIVGAKRPRILEERGLAAALEWLSGEFSERTGIPCCATIELPEGQYTEIVATTAFRCIQESLTNVTRHAAASKVVITVRQVGSALKLCIVDDGLGLTGDSEGRGRFGLLGLRQRAQALGGQMDIESRPKQGTTIKISLPAMPTASTATARSLMRWPNVTAANSTSTGVRQ